MGSGDPKLKLDTNRSTEEHQFECNQGANNQTKTGGYGLTTGDEVDEVSAPKKPRLRCGGLMGELDTSEGW